MPARADGSWRPNRRRWRGEAEQVSARLGLSLFLCVISIPPTKSTTQIKATRQGYIFCFLLGRFSSNGLYVCLCVYLSVKSK